MILPILIIFILCAQITIGKTAFHKIQTNPIDAFIYKSECAIYKHKQNRLLPSNLKGFKLKWNQKVIRNDNQVTIFTPWYFKKNTGYLLLGIGIIISLVFLLQGYPWGHLINSIPIAFGTAWIDGNTQASPTANDMDGGGTDLATGDTVNITKALVIDKSVGCGNLTTPTLTINTSTILTMDAAAVLTTTSSITIIGTLACGNATINCTGIGATGSGYSMYINGGTYTGGTGASHTIGSLIIDGSGTLSLTTGNTIFSGASNSGALTIAITTAITLAHNYGTVTFTRAGIQHLYDQNKTARTLYNLVVNNATCDLHYYNAQYFALTVANNLTITAGSFTTWDGTTSANLTVTGLTTVTKTLDIKAGTASFNGGINVAVGAAFNNSASSVINIRANSKIEIASTINGALNVITGTLVYTSIDLANGASIVVSSGASITPISGGYSYNNYILGGNLFPTVTLNGNDPAPYVIIQNCTIAGSFNPERTRFEQCVASYSIIAGVPLARVRKAQVLKAMVFRSEM